MTDIIFESFINLFQSVVVTVLAVRISIIRNVSVQPGY